LRNFSLTNILKFSKDFRSRVTSKKIAKIFEEMLPENSLCRKYHLKILSVFENSEVKSRTRKRNSNVFLCGNYRKEDENSVNGRRADGGRVNLIAYLTDVLVG